MTNAWGVAPMFALKDYWEIGPAFGTVLSVPELGILDQCSANQTPFHPQPRA
jgi:hypothetical protein